MSLVWTSEVIYREDDDSTKAKIRKLSDILDNTKIKICDFMDSSHEFLRLAEMGFTPKSIIKVIKNDGKNPLIIQTKNVKLMIARKLAENIFVE
ncbi:MAG: FeoA family protein [Candidatus Kariarchaeaceae archaeon]|jgi:Fe2+ transport system protein FeoA